MAGSGARRTSSDAITDMVSELAGRVEYLEKCVQRDALDCWYVDKGLTVTSVNGLMDSGQPAGYELVEDPDDDPGLGIRRRLGEVRIFSHV